MIVKVFRNVRHQIHGVFANQPIGKLRIPVLQRLDEIHVIDDRSVGSIIDAGNLLTPQRLAMVYNSPAAKCSQNLLSFLPTFRLVPSLWLKLGITCPFPVLGADRLIGWK